jgi:Protein of unknown function (DUF3750)
MESLAVAFALLYLLPLMASAVLYLARGARIDWKTADRSSSGLLTPARDTPAAVVRVFSARTVSWRGIFATHSWLVVKAAGAPAYRRFDYTAWGEPIWIDRFAPDARWFGSSPDLVLAADGREAQAMIPLMTQAIQDYRYTRRGDYRLWPGPNSTTFIATIMAAVPSLRACLPPTAIGKDFPYDGRWAAVTPSRTGIRLNAGGYAGITLAWVEGVELNLLGAVAGLDIRPPALKLPGLGRIQMPGVR